jgi:signal transduction histidine kinase
LVAAALLGVAGIVSIWYSLRTGVTQVKDGLARLEEDFGFRLEDSGGDFGEIARAVNQMAERRAHLEANLRKQDRLAALGKVVAGVAHEIRNPLNSIRLTLELLDRRLRKGAATGAEVEAAIGEIDRLDRILARLLAFGRPALTERRVRDLGSLVRSAAGMVHDRAQRKSVSLNVDVSENLEADVDGPQIEQVLINLLLNAIEASPPGGSVSVIAAATETGIRISVADEGPGIPDGARPHIFDAYYTTKPEGTGLGLSISCEIVANHGGSLGFETGPEGTLFHVDLPAERQPGETQAVGTAGRG